MSDARADDALLRAVGRYAREEQQKERLDHERDERDELSAKRREQIARAVRDVLVPPRMGPVSGFRQLRDARIPQRWLAWTLPLSAAAVLLLWELRKDPIELLTPYQLEVSATAAVTRGAGTGSITVRAGAMSTLVLRPTSKLEGAVTALLFLQRAAHIEPLAAEVTPDASGAVRVRVELAEGLASDHAKLLVLVTRPERLHVAQALASGHAERGPDFQRWTVPILP